jgi:hypothetical protein
MADFKNLQPALKIYQVHSAFESGILKIVTFLKRLYEIKKKIQACKWVSRQVDHIKVKLLQH